MRAKLISIRPGSPAPRIALVTLIALIAACASNTWYYRPSLEEAAVARAAQSVEYPLRGQREPGTALVRAEFARLDRALGTTIQLTLTIHNGGDPLDLLTESFELMTPGATRYTLTEPPSVTRAEPGRTLRTSLRFHVPDRSPEDIERFRFFWAYQTADRVVKETTVFVRVPDRIQADTEPASALESPVFRRQW